MRAALLRLAPFALIFLLGIMIGYVLRGPLPFSGRGAHQFFSVRQGGFQYINPLLECESTRDSIENSELRPFRDRVEGFIKTDLNKSWADDISVYFRDLNTGEWFSIGPTQYFAPASLLKVPFMIALLKEAETDPWLLMKTVRYKDVPDYNTMENFKPQDTMKPGESYTIDELIYRMIVYSDNSAFALLESFLRPDVIKKLFNDFGLKDPFENNEEYFLSAEQYASFFRILYNSSYLTKNMSERALEYLANSDFRAGLVAGVPGGVGVAHKFGERAFGKDAKVKQLHDCGIVYHPKHPYLLCIMTQGGTFEYLDDAIRELSRVVYDEVDKQRRDR